MATILIVDDRAICRELLVTLLGYGHHHLLEASDGAEALAIIKKEKLDLIITDLLMPTMNGYELVQEIKLDSTLTKIPIIFYTASFLLDEAKLLAETCDVKYVLYKPSDPQLILDTVAEALGTNTAEPTTDKPTTSNINTTTQPLIEQGDKLSTYLTELKNTKQTFNAAMHETQLSKIDEGHLLKVSEQISQSFYQLSRISNQLIAMSNLSLNMIAQREPKHLLKIFCEGARKVLDSKYCFLGILDANNNKLRRFAVSGVDKNYEGEMDTPSIDCGLIKQILATDNVLRLNTIDEAEKAGLPGNQLPINCFLGIRLITATQLYGFIYFIDKQDGTEFNECDSQIANTLATEISMLYENLEFYEIIQRHAAKLQVAISEHDKTNH